MRFGPGQVHSEPTGVLGPVEPQADLDDAALADRFDAMMAESTAESLRGLDRAVISLSGGFDSRLVLHHCVRHGVQMQAATWGSTASDEFRCSRRVAAAAGLPHERVSLDLPADARAQDMLQAAWDLEQLPASTASYTTAPWVRFLAQRGLPVVTGFFGNNLCGKQVPNFGVPEHRYDQPPEAAIDFLAGSITRMSNVRLLSLLMHREFCEPFAPRMIDTLVDAYRRAPDARVYQRLYRLGTHIGIRTGGLRTDLHAWAFAVPPIAPLYTRRNIEFFMALPARFATDYRTLFRLALWAKAPQLARLRRPDAPLPAWSPLRIRRWLALLWAERGRRRVVRRRLESQPHNWPMDPYTVVLRQSRLMAEELRRAEPILGHCFNVTAVADALDRGDRRVVGYKRLLRLFNLCVFYSRFFGV